MTKSTEPSGMASTAQQDLETRTHGRRKELFTLLVALNAKSGAGTPEVRDKLKARLSELAFERSLAEPLHVLLPERVQS